MPTYLALGTLTQRGYDNLARGPETVERFVDRAEGMGGTFHEDDFDVGRAEYQHAGVVELPSHEAATHVADTSVRSGRGRLQLEPVVAVGPDGYAEYVDGLVEETDHPSRFSRSSPGPSTPPSGTVPGEALRPAQNSSRRT